MDCEVAAAIALNRLPDTEGHWGQWPLPKVYFLLVTGISDGGNSAAASGGLA